MALNLANTAEIMAAYDAVLANELNWLLLHYPKYAVDELALYAFGSNGLEELKTKVDPSDTEQALVGFVRVDDVVVPGAEETEEEFVKYVLVSYVPTGVLGVRRARAKVHSRRLGMIFKKHDAVLTIEDISQLTNAAITQALAEPHPSLLTFSGPTGTGPSSPPFSPPFASTAGPSDFVNAPPVGSPVAHQQQHPHHQSLTATDMGRSFSQPIPVNGSKASSNPQGGPSTGLSSLRPVRRSFSEIYAPHHPPPPTGPESGHHKAGSSMFSQFLRRKKKSTPAIGRAGDLDESQESEDSMPPPTPPKDKGIYAPVELHTSEGKGKGKAEGGGGAYGHSGGVTETGEFMYDLPSPRTHEPVSLAPELATISESSFRRIHSISEFAVVSHEDMNGRSSGDTDVVVVRPEGFDRFDKPLPLAGQGKLEVGINTLKKGKWAEPQGLSAIRDPSERARLRMEMQRQKEEEEEEIARAEEERQERIRRKKEELKRREEEEAERRKAAIQAEALRVAAERRRREEEERLEEERKAKEREDRKRSEKAKRLEEHLRLEGWRREQQKIAEEATRREKEAKKREEKERKEKILKAENEVKQKAREGAMTGYVTIQTDDSVVWRRRYYKFSPNTFYFYRNTKDLTRAVDKIDVRGVVKALKEPKDGYEDLEAIPFSFAIEFHDREPWSMYADSEEEKFKLLGLLKYAAGLPV